MSIIDVSRASTFCSATARSLAGLRSATDDAQEFRHVVAVHRQAGDPDAQKRETGATINQRAAMSRRTSSEAASSCCSFLLLHKHSYSEELPKPSESAVEAGCVVYPVTKRNRTTRPPRNEPDQDKPADRKSPLRPGALAWSHGPSTLVRSGITTHWRMATLSVLLISIDASHSQGIRGTRPRSTASNMTVG